MTKSAHLLFAGVLLWGCSSAPGTGESGQGGSAATGGTPATTGQGGGAGTGGNTTQTGGAPSSGGTVGSGGATGSGGAPASGGTIGTGGRTGDRGGSSGGGTVGTGGATGGSGMGGGGPGSGGTKGGMAGGAGDLGGGGALGTGGTTPLPSYFLGADITDQEPAGTTAINNLLASMKANGFNFVRLRTFVDPKAADGYDRTNGYDDITHTVAFGKLVKAAGMGLLIDFHMSDNWADPGKQCVPVAWQGYGNIADLAGALQSYVQSAITALVTGGARPDMVQIGNETTPGMLLHLCDSSGRPISGMTPKVTGAASTAGWSNLGKLLKAGVAGVKAVDPGILISFHIDKGGDYAASKYWLDNAIAQGATPDAFGESCYQQYQGSSSSQSSTQSGWQSTFSQLAAAYPNIRFFAAEYGPMERQINDVVFGLSHDQGLGTFDWEPTTQGDWNARQGSDPMTTTTHALWQRSGNSYNALPDLSLYPPMKTAYGSRL